MDDFEAKDFVLVREVNGLRISSNAVTWQVEGKGAGPAGFISSKEIVGNSRHYLRDLLQRAGKMDDLASGKIAGVVTTTVNGASTPILITSEQIAAVSAEVERFSTWQAAVAAKRTARKSSERAYDRGMNEGGEGYNPHRTGDRPTYR